MAGGADDLVHRRHRGGLHDEAIVVLGETILAVAFGTSLLGPGGSIASRSYVIGGAAFTIAVSAWWLYFERFDEKIIDRLLEVGDDHWLEAKERGLVYVFSHFPIHIEIVVFGVGISTAIDASIEGHALEGGGLLVMCGGVGAFLLAASTCHRVLPNRIRDVVVAARVGAAAVLASIPFVFPSISPLLLVAAIALVLLGLIVFEARGRTVRRGVTAGAREVESRTISTIPWD